MFLDEGIYEFKSGKGGDGVKSFRREKHAPKGGPDGGDGGRGGHVYLLPNSQLHTLYDLERRTLIKAEEGHKGSVNHQTGRSGEDLVLKVPLGTLIYDAQTDELIYDLCIPNEPYLLCPGGQGGKGNAHFKSSTNQAPTRFTEGQPGTYKKVRLELKLMADCALVGLPNAGKSSLISRLSQATPKIADYPFTTLQPHLGVVKPKGRASYVIADIPGLIEGAATGKGLGNQFLRHIERCMAVALVIDATDPDWKKNRKLLLGELKKYNPELAQKPRILIFSKCDLISPENRPKAARMEKKVFYTSSQTREGLDLLTENLAEILNIPAAEAHSW